MADDCVPLAPLCLNVQKDAREHAEKNHCDESKGN